MHTEHVKPLKPVVHVFIILFFVVHFGLIVFSYMRQEQFFGWRMFASALIYRTSFYGLKEGDVREPVPYERFRFWLRDKARVYFRHTDGFRLFGRGREYLLFESERFARFLCQKMPEERYVKIQASVEFKKPNDPAIEKRSVFVSCKEEALS